MVSKKKKKKKVIFTFLNWGKTDIVLGKKVAIFDWESGQNSALEKGRKDPVMCDMLMNNIPPQSPISF